MSNASTSKLLYKCFIVIISNALMGLGSGLLRLTSFGVDPFSGMTLGTSYFLQGILHLEFMTCGVFQASINMLLLIVVIACNRKYIGFGMVFNMFFLGFICDGSERLGLLFFTPPLPLPLRLLLLVVCIILIAMGVGVYSAANMGMGPYDALAYIISEKSNHRFHVRYTRMATDILCVVLAVAAAFPLGKQATVAGVATIIMAFGLGPLNYFFRVHLGENLLLKNVR
ncbi:MAG: hypothetical protein PHC41_12060 [Lachnospiraceae bacterium]|jgi:uncharacterized membrane protein YczE|nr:hypothetical protein [Lachnospiraceae bacterium]MDD3616943.1 hypothetical protein [Lachnospiraceae bacterium]